MASSWEQPRFDGAGDEFGADRSDQGQEPSSDQIPNVSAEAGFTDSRLDGAGYSLEREIDPDVTIDDGETRQPLTVEGTYQWAPPSADLADFERRILGISDEEASAAQYEREVYRAPAARGIFEVLESAQDGLLVKYGPEDPGEPIRTLRVPTDNGELVVKTSELDPAESEHQSEPLFLAAPRPERYNEQAYRLTVEASRQQTVANPGQDGESLPMLVRVRLGFDIPPLQDVGASTELVELSLEALDEHGQPDPERLATLLDAQELTAPEGVNPADAEEAYKVGLALDIVQQISWTDQAIKDLYSTAAASIEQIEPIEVAGSMEREDRGSETDESEELDEQEYNATLRAARSQFVEAARQLLADTTIEQGDHPLFNQALLVPMIDLLTKAANDRQLSDSLAALDDIWASFESSETTETGAADGAAMDVKDEVAGLIQQLESSTVTTKQLLLARAYAIDGWQLHNQESQMKLYALLAAEKQQVSAARLAESDHPSITGEPTQAILSDVVDSFSQRECDTSDLLQFAITDQDRWELSFMNSQYIGDFDDFQRHCKELVAGGNDDRYSQQFVFERLPLLIEQAGSAAYADEDTTALRAQMLETYLTATRLVDISEVNLGMSIDYGIRLLPAASASDAETMDGYINDDIESLTELIADPNLRSDIVIGLAGMRAKWTAALSASDLRRQSPEAIEKQFQDIPEPIDWNDARLAAIEQYINRWNDARLAAIEQYVNRGAFDSAQKLLQKLPPSLQLPAYVETWNRAETASELAELNPQSNQGVHVYTPELPALYERAKALVAEDPDIMIRHATNTAREMIAQVHQPPSETQPNPGVLLKLEWRQLNQLLWRVAALQQPDKARELSRDVVTVLQDEPVWLLHTRGGLEYFYETLVNSSEPSDHELVLRSLQTTIGPEPIMPENRAAQLALVTKFGNKIA